MKKVIIIISLLVANIFVSLAQNCDTLKWKGLKTNYVDANFRRIGNVNGTTINIDTLPIFTFEYAGVNVSNDTFLSNGNFNITLLCYIHTDTGVIATIGKSFKYSFNRDYFPNDTILRIFPLAFEMLPLINAIKEDIGVELEEITHWEAIIGISYTSQDGKYSDSIFSMGTDTSTFYIVRGEVGVQEIEKNQPIVSVYPNPAKTHFTVTNTENAEIQLFNVLGQKVFQTFGTQENTVVNTVSLPQGLYVLKVVKDNVSTVHKVLLSEP